MTASSPDAPALRLHHVGVVVADIDTARCDYVDRLGYRLRTGVIHDPVQTAYVQFLMLGDEGPFVELVAPDRPASRLTNALRKGGGLNHLCYSTDDIDAACQVLRRRGFVLIREPEPAVAFGGRRIAWLMAENRVLTELVERDADPQAL